MRNTIVRDPISALRFVRCRRG